MCRKVLLPVLFFFCCTVTPVSAQFNPQNQATRIEKLPNDTLLKSAVQNAPELKFELYSDAYDQYLKKLRSKQRNSYELKPGLTITQSSYTNWQTGGDNSFTGIAALYFEHNYKAPVFSVKSVFDAKYGLTRITGQTRKPMDYFNVSVTPSWNISPRWKLSTALIWKSQFSRGYDYPKDKPKVWKSTFMAPGTIEISGGFTYESKNKELNILLSPIAGKMIFVLSDSLSKKGGFGIDKGEKFDAELGMLGRLNYNTKFAKEKIGYRTKLETFWNYKNLPTINWENNIDFKITNIFSVTLFTQLLFNDQIRTPKVLELITDDNPTPKIAKWRYIQFYETVGFTLSFSIKSKPHKPVEESTITRSRLKYKN